MIIIKVEMPVVTNCEVKSICYMYGTINELYVCSILRYTLRTFGFQVLGRVAFFAFSKTNPEHLSELKNHISVM